MPEEKFTPMGSNKERDKYRIHYFKKGKNPKTPEGADNRQEWYLDTGLHVSGTTLLNGFQEMLKFYMADFVAVKEDYRNARRFSPLLQPPAQGVLPMSSTERFQTALNEETAITRERILEIEPHARELMEIVAPQVIGRLAGGKAIHETTQMEIDGILRHPDKIRIFDRTLEQFSREQRFEFARVVARMIKEGVFTEWIRSLQEPKNQKFVQDIITRNTEQLLLWFKRAVPADVDLEVWIARAHEAAEVAAQGIDTRSKTMRVRVGDSPAVAAGANPLHSPEYQQVYGGMIASCVERFLEYKAQEYLGGTLDNE